MSGSSDGSGYGDGCGYGDGSGYGFGDGSGFGDGFGFGSSDGCGFGDGSGFGDGFGFGCGDGFGDGFGCGDGFRVGYVDEHRAAVHWPGYLRIGCQCHSLDHWREHWRSIASTEGVSVSEDAAEEIMDAAEAVTMEQIADAWGAA